MVINLVIYSLCTPYSIHSCRRSAPYHSIPPSPVTTPFTITHTILLDWLLKVMGAGPFKRSRRQLEITLIDQDGVIPKRTEHCSTAVIFICGPSTVTIGFGEG